MKRAANFRRRIGGKAAGVNSTGVRLVCYAEPGMEAMLCGKGFGPRPNYSSHAPIVTCGQCLKALKRRERGLT